MFPRRIMAPIWLLYTVIHGLLLILQYSMLLGVPPGACFYPGGERGMYLKRFDTLCHLFTVCLLGVVNCPFLIVKLLMYITIGYPWDDIVPSSETNFGLRKWLFLADYPQILDKTVLYGMYIQCLNASFSTPT